MDCHAFGSWPRQPLLMPAFEHVGLPEARARTGLTGAGAAVCVIDSGIDVRHADFRDASGRTRVRWLLDLSASPRGTRPDLETRYGGAVWSAADLDDAIARAGGLPTDTHGHGTAVAGLAAGDAAGIGIDGYGELAGVAPSASLVIVKALRPTDGGFRDEDIQRGARFCLDVEDRPGRTVIVLALGNHEGGHDGADPIELELEALADRAPIVVAAGNDAAGAHAEGEIAAGAYADVSWDIPASEGDARATALVIGDPAIRVSLRAPDGTETSLVEAGGSDNVPNETSALAVTASAPPRPDGARMFEVAVSTGSDRRALRAGTYRIRLAGPGAFHAWIAGFRLPGALFSPRFSGPWVNRNATVMVPATAPSVIAVGAALTQNDIATNEATLTMTDISPSDRAWFSPTGPTRVGVPKPDLLAPGGWNIAALSGDLVAGAVANFSAAPRPRNATRASDPTASRCGEHLPPRRSWQARSP